MRKKILLFTILSLCTLQSNSQAFRWGAQFEGNALGVNVVTDNNLNVYSSGRYADTIDLDPSNSQALHTGFFGQSAFGQNSYLSKLDSNGAFVWAGTYSVSAHNVITAIDVDDQNNILVIGYFSDSIDLDFGSGNYYLYHNVSTSASAESIFIAKYDPNGTLLWGNSISNVSSNGANTTLWGGIVKADHNNDIFIQGSFRDTVDFDLGPGVNLVVSESNYNNNQYEGDDFLLKIDAAGNFLWVKTWYQRAIHPIAVSGFFTANYMDIDSNNNVFFTFSFVDTFDADPSPAVTNVVPQGIRDVCVLKISSTGTLIWHKEVGGLESLSSNNLVVDRWGNVYFCVLFNSPLFDADPGPGLHMIATPLLWNQADQVLIKLDNNGNFRWALKNLPNSDIPNQRTAQLSTDGNGGVFMATEINTYSNQMDLNPGAGVYMVDSVPAAITSGVFAFQNFDSTGQFIWGGNIIGPHCAPWVGVCADRNGVNYVTSNFPLTNDLNPTIDTTNFTNNTPYCDAYVIKLDNCNKSTSEIIQSCDSVWYNNQVYFSDTVFQYHYTSSIGCDSAHAVIIDVKTMTNDTINISSCNFYIWNNITYTSSGLYTNNFGEPGGCDSIVTLNLIITPPVQQSLSFTECDNLTFGGTTYSQTGQYLHQINNLYSCDTNYTINFTKVVVDTSVTITSPTSLQANANNATYQWVDCSTLQTIVGDTTAFFNAAISGSYACVVTQNGCTDTSGCYTFSLIPDGITDYSILSRVYPNPSTGTYQLELDKSYQNVQLEIRTINGQVIWDKNYQELKDANIDIDKAPGVYMLYIKQGGRTQVKKLLKW